MLSFKGQVFGVEPPTFVELWLLKQSQVLKAIPLPARRNHSRNWRHHKGAVVVEEGDVIRIDTRNR